MLSGPRLFATTASKPALPNVFASAPPMLPAPIIPIVMSQSFNQVLPLIRERTVDRHINSRRWTV